MEVLVALTIVAVALIASLRAVGSMATSAYDLRQRTLAQWSAENRLSQMRVQSDWPPVGQNRQDCPQAGVALVCQEEVFATPNPFFRRVEIAVYEAGGRRPLARLTGFVTSGNA